MKFNWEEFISNDKIAVHCRTEEQAKYYMEYNARVGKVGIEDFMYYTPTNILFTDESILRQAIESIGQERLIRDYFGIDANE